MDTQMQYPDVPAYATKAFDEDHPDTGGIDAVDNNLWMYLSSLEEDGSVAPFQGIVSAQCLNLPHWRVS